MPLFRITSPDGKTYEVTAPEGATEQDALAHVQQMHQKVVNQIQNDPISVAAREQATKPFWTFTGGMDWQPPDPVTARGLEGMQEHPWGSGAPKVANEAGGYVTDALTKAGLGPRLSAGLGAASNAFIQGLPTLITMASSPESATSLARGPAKWLMQKAVKPSMVRNTPEEVSQAMDTMLEKNIYPTVGSMTKNAMAGRALDEKVGQILAKHPNVGISTSKAVQPARDYLAKQAFQVNPESDIAAAENAIEQFARTPAGSRPSIPVRLAHALKKGTYQSLGSKAYGEIGTSSVEAQKQLARGLKEGVAAAVPETVSPLAEQAARMNVNDVVMQRALTAANNNPLGLAALRFDDPASAIAFLADRSAPFKAMLAHALYGLGKPNVVTPTVMAGQTGLEALKKRAQE